MRIASTALAAVCLLPGGFALGQQTVSGSASSMKSALLAANGFAYEGDCINAQIFAGQLTFKEQGDKLFVSIAGGGGVCDSPVEVSGDRFQFELCSGTPARVEYNSADKGEPFKGQTTSPRCNFVMKPK